jgi:hypothetical protein
MASIGAMLLSSDNVPLLATCQRPNSTNRYAAIQHHPADASAGVADNCSSIGGYLHRSTSDPVQGVTACTSAYRSGSNTAS